MVLAAGAQLEQDCHLSLVSSLFQLRSLRMFLKHRWKKVWKEYRDFCPAWALGLFVLFIWASRGIFACRDVIGWQNSWQRENDTADCYGQQQQPGQGAETSMKHMLLEQSAQAGCVNSLLEKGAQDLLTLPVKLLPLSRQVSRFWGNSFTHLKAGLKVRTDLLALKTNQALLTGRLITRARRHSLETSHLGLHFNVFRVH